MKNEQYSFRRLMIFFREYEVIAVTIIGFLVVIAMMGSILFVWSIMTPVKHANRLAEIQAMGDAGITTYICNEN